jgi:hypothetical protein
VVAEASSIAQAEVSSEQQRLVEDIKAVAAQICQGDSPVSGAAQSRLRQLNDGVAVAASSAPTIESAVVAAGRSSRIARLSPAFPRHLPCSSRELSGGTVMPTPAARRHSLEPLNALLRCDAVAQALAPPRRFPEAVFFQTTGTVTAGAAAPEHQCSTWLYSAQDAPPASRTGIAPLPYSSASTVAATKAVTIANREYAVSTATLEAPVDAVTSVLHADAELPRGLSDSQARQCALAAIFKL